jgi:endonuclease YncB( thermonuclease family)
MSWRKLFGFTRAALFTNHDPPQYRRIPALGLNAMRGWVGVMPAVLAAVSLSAGGFGASALEKPRAGAPACGAAIVAHGSAGRVIDGRTFVLADGREVRLAGIEVPPLSQEPGGAAAKDALTALLAGGDIVLRQAEQQGTDRYGRLLAFASLARDGAERSVAGELVASGLARVAVRAGTHACAEELLARERAARRARLGLWAGSYYDSLNADSPAAVLAEQGRFALVEGKVVSVRESGATIYVNFGRRWTTDFTVTIPKRSERNFTAAGLEPKKLAGQRVRVRGWIEARGGPQIEAARPEQIELADRE